LVHLAQIGIVVLIVWNVMQAFYLRRVRREVLLKLQETEAGWNEMSVAMGHVRIVDHLLTAICADAFATRHLPIWAARAPVMGDYEIIVNAIRKERDDAS
jgi:hypothetical protein